MRTAKNLRLAKSLLEEALSFAALQGEVINRESGTIAGDIAKTISRIEEKILDERE